MYRTEQRASPPTVLLVTARRSVIPFFTCSPYPDTRRSPTTDGAAEAQQGGPDGSPASRVSLEERYPAPTQYSLALRSFSSCGLILGELLLRTALEKTVQTEGQPSGRCQGQGWGASGHQHRC